MGRCSAHPDRLQRFGQTTGAVREGLMRRAGNLENDWDAYVTTNGAEWRFDFSDLPAAIEAWADTLANIGSWTAEVGVAFERAETGDLVTSTDDRVRDLISADAREQLDAAGDTCAFVDWGEPDDPPPWLEALQTTSVVFDHASDGTQAMTLSFVQAVAGYTRSDGTVIDPYLRYRPGTGARGLLGGFASARNLAQFDMWFSGSAEAFVGFAAGFSQWADDSGTLNYTRDEQLGRALIRGVGTAGTGVLGGMGGALLASSVCGPGAPVCAGVVIVGTGLVASGVGDRILDGLLGEPAPGEHDLDMVEIRAETGGDIDNTNMIDGEAGSLGVQAGVAESIRIDDFLHAAALDPSVAELMDLPTRLPVIDYSGFAEVVGWTDRPATSLEGRLTPEEIASIVEYERSLGG